MLYNLVLRLPSAFCARDFCAPMANNTFLHSMGGSKSAYGVDIKFLKVFWKNCTFGRKTLTLGERGHCPNWISQYNRFATYHTTSPCFFEI